MRVGFALLFLLLFLLGRLFVCVPFEVSSLSFQHSYFHLWFGSVILKPKFCEENDLRGQ